MTRLADLNPASMPGPGDRETWGGRRPPSESELDPCEECEGEGCSYCDEDLRAEAMEEARAERLMEQREDDARDYEGPWD